MSSSFSARILDPVDWTPPRIDRDFKPLRIAISLFENRPTMRRLAAILSVWTPALPPSCSSDTISPSFDDGAESDAAECAGTPTSSVTVEGSQLDRLAGHPKLSGEVTISVLAREDPSQSFTDPFTGVAIEAEGAFIGYRYSVSNETNAELQPATQINDELRLTDGSSSWPTADYTGTHAEDVSDS